MDLREGFFKAKDRGLQEDPAPAKGKGDTGANECTIPPHFQAYKKEDCLKWVELTYKLAKDTILDPKTVEKNWLELEKIRMLDATQKPLEQITRHDLETWNANRIWAAGKITKKRIDAFQEENAKNKPEDKDLENRLGLFVHNPMYSDITLVNKIKNQATYK